MILIADLSNNNGDVNVAVTARIVDGIYHKATEGTGFVDRWFQVRRAAALQAGCPFGAYHFAHVDQDPIAQARLFCDTVKTLGRHDLLPAVDVETGDPGLAYDWTHRFNGVIHERFGRYPIFYSYPDYIARMRAPHTLGAGLWLASYSKNDGADHGYMVPAPWQHVLLHQFTSVAKLGGVAGNADLSHGLGHVPLAHPVLGSVHR